MPTLLPRAPLAVRLKRLPETTAALPGFLSLNTATATGTYNNKNPGTPSSSPSSTDIATEQSSSRSEAAAEQSFSGSELAAEQLLSSASASSSRASSLSSLAASSSKSHSTFVYDTAIINSISTVAKASGSHSSGKPSLATDSTDATTKSKPATLTSSKTRTYKTTASPVSIITTLSMPGVNSNTGNSSSSTGKSSAAISTGGNSATFIREHGASATITDNSSALMTFVNTTRVRTQTLTVTSDIKMSKSTVFTTRYSTMLVDVTPGSTALASSSSTTFGYVYTQPYEVTDSHTTFDTNAPTTVTVATYAGATAVSLSNYATMTVSSDYYKQNVLGENSSDSKVPKLAGSITGSIGALAVILILIWLLFRKKDLGIVRTKFGKNFGGLNEKMREKTSNIKNHAPADLTSTGSFFSKNTFQFDKNNRSTSDNSDNHNILRSGTTTTSILTNNTSSTNNTNNSPCDYNNGSHNFPYQSRDMHASSPSHSKNSLTVSSNGDNRFTKFFQKLRKPGAPRPVPSRRTSAESAITTDSSITTNSTSTAGSDNGLLSIRDNILQGMPNSAGFNFFRKNDSSSDGNSSNNHNNGTGTAGSGRTYRGTHLARNRVIDTVYEESMESLHSSKHSSLASTGSILRTSISRKGLSGMRRSSSSDQVAISPNGQILPSATFTAPLPPKTKRPMPKAGPNKVSKHSSVYAKNTPGLINDRYSRVGLRNYYINENPFETSNGNALDDVEEDESIHNEFDDDNYEYNNNDVRDYAFDANGQYPDTDPLTKPKVAKHPPPPPLPRKARMSHDGDNNNLQESGAINTSYSFKDALGDNNNPPKSPSSDSSISIHGNGFKRRSYESASSGEPFILHNDDSRSL